MSDSEGSCQGSPTSDVKFRMAQEVAARSPSRVRKVLPPGFSGSGISMKMLVEKQTALVKDDFRSEHITFN
eukprot:m.12521 g.12521  ORF g.12521 m.12521 type:complete len:71 (-) comp4663_c0_seq1:211-423(-)